MVEACASVLVHPAAGAARIVSEFGRSADARDVALAREGDVAAFERGFLLENPHPPSKQGMLGHFHADKTHDTLDRLGQIRVPTLITSGEVDWQVPTRYGLEVQKRIPGSTLHVFKGPHSSHIAFHEMAEEWNAFTKAWLDRCLALRG